MRFGFHISIAGGFSKVVERAHSFKRLAEGEGDDLPEGAFMYVGTLDDARAKAEKMKA